MPGLTARVIRLAGSGGLRLELSGLIRLIDCLIDSHKVFARILDAARLRAGLLDQHFISSQQVALRFFYCRSRTM